LTSRPDLAPGELLAGRWRLEACVGIGGMGEVWRARHDVLGREVAVKFLGGTVPLGRERLLQEAKLLASLRHPALVEVFDFGEHAGVPFYVMELLRGQSLARRIHESGPLGAGEAVGLLLPVLDGLEIAHEAGVVHRDVKPDNVFLTSDGGAERAKLVDFGIARVRSRTTRLTATGGLVGTPDYIAPEVLRGADADPRADIWAMGATLYETLFGAAPFESADVATTMHRILAESPTRIAGADDALWSVLSRALEKAPEARWRSAADMARALRDWAARKDADSASRTMPAPARARPAPLPTLAASPPPASPPDPLRGTLDALIRTKLTPR
jgi:serine/threonine-protein kinase